MNETKRIIVEFGAQRQQFALTDRVISVSKLLHLISNHFGIKLDNNSSYTLEMYNNILNDYYALDEEKQTFDLIKDIKQLHRFRIVSKPRQSQKYELLNNLYSTVEKLQHAARDVDKIQNLIFALNCNCDTLNQSMNNEDIYVTNLPLVDDFEDENFESVSCYNNTPVNTVHPPPPIPVVINSYQQELLTTNNNIQTRIIPCKYAVRGTCRLGDNCSYLHDEACIRSAREWERCL